MHVLSIDNGPLRQHVLDTGLVEHLRADGFHWHPEQPLDWMVCDMVEQPRRVAERMATWFREGWCRHAIFNLKLPMKKRWDETRLCLDLFRTRPASRWWCVPSSSITTVRRSRYWRRHCADAITSAGHTPALQRKEHPCDIERFRC